MCPKSIETEGYLRQNVGDLKAIVGGYSMSKFKGIQIRNTLHGKNNSNQNISKTVDQAVFLLYLLCTEYMCLPIDGVDIMYICIYTYIPVCISYVYTCYTSILSVLVLCC